MRGNCRGPKGENEVNFVVAQSAVSQPNHLSTRFGQDPPLPTKRALPSNLTGRKAARFLGTMTLIGGETLSERVTRLKGG